MESLYNEGDYALNRDHNLPKKAPSTRNGLHLFDSLLFILERGHIPGKFHETENAKAKCSLLSGTNMM